MSQKTKTATDFLNQLKIHLRALSIQTGEDIQRLRRKVAFDRFLARICMQKPSSFFLKGGYGMELRIAHARATKDIDLTCLTRVKNSKEPLGELILQELQTLARIDLNDYFIFHVGQPRSDIENAPQEKEASQDNHFRNATKMVIRLLFERGLFFMIKGLSCKNR